MECSITHNLQKHRFETVVDGYKAHIEYVPFDGGIRLTHTVVSAPIEGRGVAAALVKEALDFARTQGVKVIPICSYVVVYMKRHPEYNDILMSV